MKNSIIKLTWRSIRSFFGRYMALLLIVMISSGFFAGLKVTKDAMVNACGKYLDEQAFYDFRLLSTLGFSEDAAAEFRKLDGVKSAEGSKSVDAMIEYGDSTSPFKLMSLPEEINLPSLTAGRMPTAVAECVADDRYFGKEDIGKTLRIAANNEDTVLEMFTGTEFTIVGLVNSPLYLNLDRGTTGIGTGALSGFLYLTAENFTMEMDTEINLTLQENAPVYSDAYDALIRKYKDEFTSVTRRLADERYEKVYQEAYEEAYEENYGEAYDKAYEEAYREAFDGAYEEAYDAAYAEAYEIAYQKAYEEAYPAAYDTAYEMAYEAAFGPAYEAAYQELLTMNRLTPAIAEQLGLTKQLEEEISGEISARLSEELPNQVATQLSEELLAHLSEELPGQLAEELKKQVTEALDEEIAKELAEQLPKEVAERLSEELPGKIEEAGLTKPDIYVLSRSENAGYASFENDSAIVSGIANIFPLFFILIAMLVCVTTMTRMVDEERTQIGVLKAMGFSSGAITAKYLLYAGSATLIGWVVGYFSGTWSLPQIFWYAYKALYDFAPLPYLFSPYLAAVTLGASLLGILGSTWLSCRRELGSEPANLIRPRVAKTGKRILLERITPLWSRLAFLQKVSLRNMFRYKQRLVMMLTGISCCAGLVVTAFGVRDSMIDIPELQFEGVQAYDMEAAFAGGKDEKIQEALDSLDGVDLSLFCSKLLVDLRRIDGAPGDGNVVGMNSVGLYGFENGDNIHNFWNLHNEEDNILFPEKGSAVVTSKIAEKLELSVGDTFEIRDADLQAYSVTVSGIFDNYINNFVIISVDTYTDAFGEWKANTVLITVREGIKDTKVMAEKLIGMEDVTSILQLNATRDTVDDMLSCLDYIISLVVMFAGALAFIVIFNLTNINIAERSREIATVQVLGFYPRETESYVLRENLMLSILASFIGLPLGTIFHYIVMKMIIVDSMAFPIIITPASYVAALICTVIFALIVNLCMKRYIGKIPMAESLKAVE